MPCAVPWENYQFPEFPYPRKTELEQYPSGEQVREYVQVRGMAHGHGALGMAWGLSGCTWFHTVTNCTVSLANLPSTEVPSTTLQIAMLRLPPAVLRPTF